MEDPSVIYHWWNVMGRSMRNFHRFPVQELQVEAEKRGLSTEGNKKKLAERLQACFKVIHEAKHPVGNEENKTTVETTSTDKRPSSSISATMEEAESSDDDDQPLVKKMAVMDVPSNEKILLANLEEIFGSKKGTSGSFPDNDWCHSGATDFLPSISVGTWKVKLPCNAKTAAELVRKCDDGDSDATQNAWQVANDKLTFEGRLWGKVFENSKSSVLLDKVRTTLAPKALSIAAHLESLVVRDKSTKTADGKKAVNSSSTKSFGKLFVFLPSVYSGGELVVRHYNKERTFQFYQDKNSLSKNRCKMVAFFNDCQSEFKPVTSGHVVYLSYDLSYEAPSKPPITPPLLGLELRLSAIFSKLFSLENWKNGSQLVGVVFEHNYSAVRLLCREAVTLKGNDAIIVETLQPLGELELEMTPVVISASGRCPVEDTYQDAEEYFADCLASYRPVDFKISRFSAKAVKALKRVENDGDSDSDCDSDDDDMEEGVPIDDHNGVGELLAEFTVNFNSPFMQSGNNKPGNKVHFVHNWKKSAIGRVVYSSASAVGNKMAEFEIQFHSSALLVKAAKAPKNKRAQKK